VTEGILRTGAAETSRAEAFSDGVLAIVGTLLVLNIKIPNQLGPGDAALRQALAQQLPMLGAWALSFFLVLVFWVAHHYFFRRLANIDRGLLWLNGPFLFAISFTPFPTALLGLYPGQSASVTMLSMAMFATAGSFSTMRWYATRHCFARSTWRKHIWRCGAACWVRASTLPPSLRHDSPSRPRLPSRWRSRWCSSCPCARPWRRTFPDAPGGVRRSGPTMASETL
jgi:uncharacterized membrane protein